MVFKWLQKDQNKKKETDVLKSDDVSINQRPKENPEQDNASGLFNRLKKGLSKTRDVLTTDIDDLFKGGRTVDDDMMDEIEELLITADIGVKTAMNLIQGLVEKSSKATISDALTFKQELKREILSHMSNNKAKAEKSMAKPHIVMIVGVNGVGKTTSIGKLAAKAGAVGKKVLISAADTFRAAAIEQLAIWAQRAGADFVKHKDHSDPAAVAYDSVEAAIARNKDIVLIDTAGRLHTRVNLMEELKKIKRIIAGKIPGAPHEILLVLDATTGQNAISQAKLFHEAIGVTGIVLTKLDGTAKGGVVISICSELNIPLKYIGIGENIEDLQEFNAEKFVDALF